MKKKKNKMGEIDYILFYSIFLLLAIGVVMVYSSSSYYAMMNSDYHNDSMYFFKRQAAFAVLGSVIMIFMMSIDYHKLKKWCGWIMLLTIGCLVIVLFFGTKINGARRWIPLGPAGFQPSEIAKYAIVIFLAAVIENCGNKVNEFKFIITRLLGMSALFAGLVLLEKNLSIAAVIMMVSLIILYVSGVPRKIFAILLGGVGVIGVAGIFVESYRIKRLFNFIDPWKSASTDGYQLIQSFYALGAGGVGGLGLGQSRQKTLYMPEPHTDFIFSIIGEELGLIGCILIITLFVIVVYRGIMVSIRAKDIFGSILATGITSVIAIQALINIAVVTGSMPVTGVPLPFISYGGSALVINMVGAGILLNISRQKER